MKPGMFAARSVAFAAAAFVSSAAWAAQGVKPVPLPVPKPVTAPATEAVLAAPAMPAPQAEPLAAQPRQAPARRAGMSKPVKIYWFLSGR